LIECKCKWKTFDFPPPPIIIHPSSSSIHASLALLQYQSSLLYFNENFSNLNPIPFPFPIFLSAIRKKSPRDGDIWPKGLKRSTDRNVIWPKSEKKGR
jgi:hypothetical protein